MTASSNEHQPPWVPLAVATGLFLGCALLTWSVVGASAPKDEPPAWVEWHDEELVDDLDGNGVAEHISVSRGRVEVAGMGALPTDWLVQRALLGDIDKDGKTDLTLLTWRKGSYGSSKPFWEERDDDWSQHVFIVREEKGALCPTWMSSALGADVSDARLDDAGRLVLVGRTGNMTLWEWSSWGLALVEPSNDDEGPLATSRVARMRMSFMTPQLHVYFSCP